MRDDPSAAELVGAVRDFLNEGSAGGSSSASASSPERRAFLTRVAVNVLGIVERELRLGPAAEAAERERLRALLGRDGSADELNRELCRRIRAGEFPDDAPDESESLHAHLRATTMDQLAIDQPKYPGYVAASREGANPSGSVE